MLRKIGLDLIVFCITSMLVDCSNQTELSELSGFWVSTNYNDNGPFYTLEIIDSVVRTNSYGVEDYSYTIWEDPDRFAIRNAHDWSVFFELSRQGDTLVQFFPNREPRTVRYLKTDSLSLGRKLLYCDSPLTIDLPDAGENDVGITVESLSLLSDVYIGHLKPGQQTDFPDVAADSTALQVFDVLINISHFQAFLKREQAKIDELDRDKLILILHADKTASPDFLAALKQKIHEHNPNFTVCRAYFNLKTREKLFKVLD